MNSCSVCDSKLEANQSCQECNPFTAVGWSRKFSLLTGGALAVVAFWLIIFFIELAGKAVAGDFFPIGAEYSDLVAAAASAGTLITGLGGSLSGTLGSTQLVSLSFPNLLIPIALFAIFKAVKNRFFTRDEGKVVSGIFFSLGATFALFVITNVVSVSGDAGSTKASVGFAVAIPLVIVGLLAYLSISGFSHWTIAKRFEQSISPYISAIKRLQRVLWVLAVVAGAYLALRMGTGLDPQLPLYAWVLAAIALLIAMPTVAFFVAPVFFGVAVNDTDIWDLAGFLADGQYQWVAWVAFSLATLFALSSSVSSAIRGTKDVNAWWIQGSISALIGVVTGWVSTFSLNLPSLFMNSTLPITGFGLTVWQTALVFLAVGLGRGLLLHPALNRIAIGLDSTAGNIYRSITQALSFKTSRLVSAIRKYFDAKHLVVRKLTKYTAVSAIVALAFFSGPGIAFAARPFYDNESTAAMRFENAIHSGDIKNISEYFKSGNFEAVVASEGSDLQVETSSVKNEKNTVRVSWNNDKNYVVLTSELATEKAPFLTVIPQWSGHLNRASLPNIKVTYGKKPVTSVLYRGNIVNVSKIFFLPGQSLWTPGSDKQKYIIGQLTKFDATKDSTVEIKFSVDSKKKESIRASVEKDFTEQYTCSAWKFNSFEIPALGNFSSTSGLPGLKSSGTGSCEADGYGKISFKYSVSGNYFPGTGEWIWTFKVN
jgi:hypothetical protein